MVPFAGIAFLWFIGVLRDRLAEREDRFFATVFLGSGVLFLAMLFVSAAVAGGVILAHNGEPGRLPDAATFALGRAVTYEIMNIYAAKMEAVFMVATSTLAIRTRFIPRWSAFLGYTLALLLLIGGRSLDGAVLVLPLWVLLISVFILIDNLSRSAPSTSGPEDAREE